MTERVVGFDLRCAPAIARRTKWRPADRERFLLDTGTKDPLSIDTAWWPSRFVVKDGRARGFAPARLIEIDPGPDTHFLESFKLWPSIGWVYYAHQPCDEGDVAIAVSLVDARHYPDGFKPDRWFELIRAAADPDVRLEPTWRLLGYDVADNGYYSALTNFARARARHDQLRVDWQDEMNPHGLFHGAEGAVRFATAMNDEHPDHAPFYAFGLWCVWGQELLP